MFKHINTPEYQELTSIIKRGQRWYTTTNGNKYPSVTTILGNKKKDGIEAWKNALGPKKAKKEMDRCAARGTIVHEMIEKYLENEHIDAIIKNKEYSNVKMFNQMKTRLGKIDNIRVQEIPMFSDKLKIAGRVDCVAEYDGVLSIIDFKTSNNTKDINMVHDYFLQCTAYAIMYSTMFREPIENIVVIIGVEKGLAPMVYKKKIDDYIAPLLRRINEFYKGK
jgi:genome maintenance exonuclease 1